MPNAIEAFKTVFERLDTCRGYSEYSQTSKLELFAKILDSEYALSYTKISFEPNPFSANPTTWSNALKQIVGDLTTNGLTVFDHFVRLVFKRLICAIELKQG